MQGAHHQSPQLSLALKGAKSGIWDWHISEEVVSFGPNYYRIAGYEPDEFPHKFEEWEARVHPDDLAAAKKAIQQYLAGELETYAAEFRFRTKSGSWMWILAQGEITDRDEAGNPTRFVGLHVDISQSKKTEQAFQEERAFNSNLVDTAQMIVLVLDVEGRICRINPYMETISGYKEAEVKGQDWFDTFLPPADHAEIREVFKTAVIDIDVRGQVNSIVAKDGRELTIEWYNKTLKDVDGSIVGLLSLGVDISGRIQAEKTFAENTIAQAVNKVLQDAVTCETDTHVAASCLSVAEEITESQFGFIGEVNSSGRLDTIAISDPGWHVCKVDKADALNLLSNMEIRGIWGKVLTEKSALILNNLDTGPFRVGLPPGHPPLTSFLGVQLIRDGKTFGMIALGNKEGGYSQQDQDRIEALSVPFVEALTRKRLTNELQHHKDHLEALVEERSKKLQRVNDQLLEEIAERKQAVQELTESEDRFKKLSIVTFEGILINHKRIITDVNDSLVRMFGYTKDELFGRNGVELLIAPESQSKVYENIKNSVTRPYEVMGRKKDGTLFPIEIEARNIVTETEDFRVAAFRDITERKQAEKKLRDSELKFKLFVDHTHDWESWTDPEGNYIYISPSCEQVTGYTQDEFRTHSQLLFDLVQPEYVETVQQHFIDKSKQQISTHSLVFPIVTKAGEERWIDHHCNPVYDEQGHYVGRRSSNRDITERKLAKFELSASEARFKALHDATFGGVIIHDQGLILDCNHALSEITGFSHDELIGMDGLKLIAPDSLDLVLRNINSGYDKGYEVEGIRKDGSIYPLAIRGKNIPYQGHEARVIEFRDITERKRAQDALLKSENKFRVLLNNQSDAIFLHEILPDGYANFSEVNDKAVERYGYSRKELLQLAPKDLNHADDNLEQIECTARQEILTQGYATFELTHIKKSGEKFPVEVNAAHIELDNRTYILSTVRDITERKQAEQDRLELETQLRQKYKMEAVGTMAGGIAHNFNNNLSIILGNVELSQLKVNNPEINGLLNNAKIAIMRSRDLVRQIMTYSRKESQAKASLQLALIIDETMKLLGATIPSTIQLNQSISPESYHTKINADASQIQEILLNLYNNAVHAMDEKGDLNIILDVVKLTDKDFPNLDQNKSSRYAKISIQDSGCGMSAETQENIFDPFFTTKEMYEGTGMGLSTVQGIVTQHDGLIKVNSTLGEGTTFDLYFPIIEQSKTVEPTSIKADMPKGSEKVLFVDDDEMVAKVGEMMLSEMGYQVVTMTESTEALKLFTANPDHFDMVITDQTMPDLTGKDLIQELKKIRPDLRTILCTGFSSKIDEDQARQQGIDAFCMKPLALPGLLQTVRRVLDGENEQLADT
jgi:PAS domain S-box-containing protein